MKAVILTSRPVGRQCFEWAKEHASAGWEISSADKHDHSEQCDIIISVAYERIIKRFHARTRYYNFHPAILPRYGGVSCASWVILNGERETGVTLHELVRKVDAGNIIAINTIPVAENDTAETLHYTVTACMFEMFKEWFPALLREHPIGVTQDSALRHMYTRKDLDAQKDLTRTIRALTFSGKESAFFKTRDGRIYALDYEKGVTKLTR